MRILLPVFLLFSHFGLIAMGAYVAEPREEVAVVIEERVSEYRQIDDYWSEVFFFYRNNIVGLALASIPDLGEIFSHGIMYTTGESVQVLTTMTDACEQLKIPETKECSLAIVMFLATKPHTWMEIGAISIGSSAGMMFLGLGYPPPRERRRGLGIGQIAKRELWDEVWKEFIYAWKSSLYFFWPKVWSEQDKQIGKKEAKYLLVLVGMGAALLLGAAMLEASITV